MTDDHRVEALRNAGLTRDQAAIYAALLERGDMTARALAQSAGVGRTLGYAILEQLVERGLVSKIDTKGAVARFRAESPSRLQALVEDNRKNAERAAEALKALLPELSSLHNLATGKPGIRFYEGEEGVKEVLYDSLSSTETIYTYADMETVDGYVGDINEHYVQLRVKKGVPKKLLMPDTSAARAEVLKSDAVTEIRLIANQDAPPLHAAMEIYDGKVSYLTFTKDILMGTIISDPAIYSLHRFLFEEQWKTALSKEDVARA
ncbi:MAG TPA: helix-turn-helix domain-containing protein [Candidatus Paceibacterota bacterium]|nr:helix-turn-helix domain-containing protein [Candidatus Paceibacterota bacterium]